METKNLIHVTGAIIKEEKIVQITANIAEHTYVAEANMPYAEYHGKAPFNISTKPNSIFLFTAHFYTLEEVLRYAQLIDLCCMPSLNIAVSVLEFAGEHYPAIRIKNFPDYKMISKLQECFIQEGVHFAKKVQIGNSAIIRTTKCFSLEKVEENIYLDHLQERTAYIALSKLIKQDKYLEIIVDIKNNVNCAMFDAARGAVLFDSKITDIIRVYSGNLDIDLLKCIQKKFEMAI
jgi:hypothetical protein